MISVDKISPIGDFTFFGFSRDPEKFTKTNFLSRLGISPRRINFDEAGYLFFFTTYGEVAEDDEAIALKLGFVRSPTKSPLSAQQLLNQKIVRPGSINNSLISGNALVVCLGKKDLKFSAFKTILGVPQLYYAISGSEIVCSDRLCCITGLLEHFELNEDVVPLHFLFRSTPGDLTYYRQIKRMLPGQSFKWADGQLSIKLEQNLNFFDDAVPFYNKSPASLDSLYESLTDVMGDYVSQVEKAGQSLATLLSGGVDSTLLQYLVNQKTSQLPPCSLSYAVRVPSFEHEIAYAQLASRLFHTEHTFVDFRPEDYPGLLNRAVDILAQPPILETEPSMLSIAEFAQANHLPARYFVSGQGADTLFGLSYSRKLKGLHALGKIPGSAWMLKGLSTILKPVKSVSMTLGKGSAMLTDAGDPDAFSSPANSIAVYGDLNIIRRCFGDETLKKALYNRREFAHGYLDSHHYLEQMHVIDLMTDTYELGVQRQQLFLAQQREQIHPFFDDDVLRSSFAFKPDVRYIKGLRPKYLLKELVEQKTNSPVARKPKGFSVFDRDLHKWMQSGPLRPLIEDIRLPGFVSRKEYDQLLKTPSYFLWVLLTFDIFQRRCLS